MPTTKQTKIKNKADFKRRFGGVARVYGDRALELYTQTHHVVIGVGGVGSWVVEALARSAIGKMTLIDMDVVAESNINRQLPALDCTLGKNKIDVLKARIADINPACEVVTIDDFVTLENVQKIIPMDADFVFDCIDNSRIKAALIAWCKRNKLPIITAGGAGGQKDPLKIKVDDLSQSIHDPLLSKTRKLLRQQYGFTTNPKRRFAVPCVYSTEQLTQPKKNRGESASDLSCAGGIGSSVAVTATFGFVAAGFVLNKAS